MTSAFAERRLAFAEAIGESGYQSVDITRTSPASGRFTGPQRAVDEVVLRAQLAAIAAGCPGAHYEAVHDVGDYRSAAAPRLPRWA